MLDRRRLLGTALAGAFAPGLGVARPREDASLDGLWTVATYTELERPEGLKTLVLDDATARAWETKLAATGGVNVGGPDHIGQAASEFPETGSGLMRIDGQIRSSIIIDPADGQIPYTKAGKAAVGIEPRRRLSVDDPEGRPHSERCLASENGGAPILPSPDTNLVQIVQTADWVAIHSEKFHDVRVVRIGAPRDPAVRPSWLGQSVGRWEGRTLVVETEGFHAGYTERAFGFFISERTRVVERFTRAGPRAIRYAFEVSDPQLYEQPWRGELMFGVSPQPMFEYACHEGNYSLANVLAGGRTTQAAASGAPAR
ncbi:MAG: hypothetical protein DI570_10535 [Phenylobacterium zucineum]|nr:MAG: hypothetical protein DI570_10535 [Phenylobacterium zucineum]